MNVNNNINNFDWSSTINQLMGAEGGLNVDGVSGTGVIDGDSLLITVTGGDGRVVQVTVENPELDPATGEPTAETLAAIIEKLDGIIDQFAEVYAELGDVVEALDAGPTSTGTQKILFDIYQLMTLMIKLAQQQREVARESRYADLEVSTAAIESQARAQRSAALTGMIMSCVFTAASLAASVGMAIKSNKAQANAAKLESQSGYAQSEKAFALSQARNKGEAKTNLSKIESKLPKELLTELQGENGPFCESLKLKKTVSEAQQKFETCLKGNPELEGKVNDLNKQIDSKTSELTDAQKEFGKLDGKAKEAQGKLEEAESNLNSEKSKLDELTKAETKDQKAIEAQEKNVEKAQGEVDKLTEKVKTAQGDADKAQEKVDGLKTDIKKLEDQKTALINEAPETEGQKNLKTLNEELEQAKGAYEKQLETDMRHLNDELDLKQSQLEHAKAELKNAEADKLPKEKINVLKEKVSTLESDVKELEQKATWGRAFVTSEFHENGMTGALERGTNDCRNNFMSKKAVLESNTDFKKYMAEANKYAAYGQIVSQLSSMVQGVSQYAANSQEAAATAEQKEQKAADAAREESNDLFSVSKEFFDSIMKLMMSVQQAEADSVRQILA